MGSKISVIDKRVSPSPDAYKLTKHEMGQSGSKWGFGSDQRKGIAVKSISPGPGAYATKVKAFDIEKPRFFMGEKIKDLKETTKVPGAGSYNPNPGAIKK